MSRGTKKRGLAAVICLAAGFALLAAAAHIPGFSQWYVTTLYPLYVGSVGRLSGMNDDVLADLRDNNAFWDLYDGSISRMSDWMNDTYLRANGQADGIASYDKMVDLIISYCKDIY